MLSLHHHSLFTLLTSLHLAAARIIAIHATDDGFSIVNGGSDAVAGDILEFHFLSQNHSVVMGDPSTPCHPVTSGGFFSGFLPTTLGENVPPPFPLPTRTQTLTGSKGRRLPRPHKRHLPPLLLLRANHPLQRLRRRHGRRHQRPRRRPRKVQVRRRRRYDGRHPRAYPLRRGGGPA